MRILLTGASGFVGPHVMARLPCVPLEWGGAPVDIRDGDRVRRAVAECGAAAVIHLAAVSAIPASFQDPRATFEANLFGTLNLLQALDAASFRGVLLYVGSGQVYGDVPGERLPVTEDELPRPVNPYAVSKLAAERLCHQWSRASPYSIVMARPFNHIGPGQDRKFAVADFAAQIAEIRLGRRPAAVQVGDLSVVRDLTDVADVADAYALLLERGRNGEVYNVCSGTGTSLQAVLDRMLALAGVSARIETQGDRLRSGEPARIVGSHRKLHAATGWSPRRPLEHSLNAILDYWIRTLDA